MLALGQEKLGDGAFPSATRQLDQRKSLILPNFTDQLVKVQAKSTMIKDKWRIANLIGDYDFDRLTSLHKEGDDSSYKGDVDER